MNTKVAWKSQVGYCVQHIITLVLLLIGSAGGDCCSTAPQHKLQTSVNVSFQLYCERGKYT